jgi:hypothetical protein
MPIRPGLASGKVSLGIAAEELTARERAVLGSFRGMVTAIRKDRHDRHHDRDNNRQPEDPAPPDGRCHETAEERRGLRTAPDAIDQ